MSDITDRHSPDARGASAVQASGRGRPLEGVRVLDLTRLLPGPLATQHLADQGAEVIKIEDTGAGDYARSMGAMAGDSSFLYQLVNRNKRSLCLDLKHPQGHDILMRLIDGADVLVESFRPGVMDRLGLGYDAVAVRNPHLVYCSISGYGQTGPYAARAGHDINFIAYAGVLDQIGVAGGAPALPNLQMGDLLGGTLSAVAGVMFALFDAARSGRGRQVDISMTDALVAHSIFAMVEVLATGGVKPRGEDLLNGGVPCYGVYATADGRYMAVGALEDKFWHLLCDTLERPDLKPFNLARGEQGAFVRSELEALFRKRKQAEWAAIFDRVDCCVTPVLRLEESLLDPHMVARGCVIEVDGVRQFATPMRLSDDEGACLNRRAPSAGADTDTLLTELGYDPAAIEALRREGVV